MTLSQITTRYPGAEILAIEKDQLNACNRAELAAGTCQAF